jgi:hypothetical protein
MSLGEDAGKEQLCNLDMIVCRYCGDGGFVWKRDGNVYRLYDPEAESFHYCFPKKRHELRPTQ